MKKILLSILLAIVATGANAQFKGCVNMKPDSRSQMDVYMISFNFATICKQMGVDREEFFYALLRGWNMPNPEFRAYLLSDDSGANCFGCDLTLDGKKAWEEQDRWWHCEGDLSELVLNQLSFAITPVLKIMPEDNPPQPKEGDRGHAVWVLEYQGKVATFDISVNYTSVAEPPIALGTLEKVGEQTLTGTVDYNGPLWLKTDVDKIAALFGGNVERGNLHLYVLADEKEQSIVECSDYMPKNLSISSVVIPEACPTDFFYVEYAAGNGTMIVSAPSDAFQGGQRTSGSVFLVADGKYYELKMDIQFGQVYDDRDSFDTVETICKNVQLMWTDEFFTYYNKEEYRYGLVSTDLGQDKLQGMLGTDSPMLYAESKADDGSVYLTRRYSAAPGQGFWFQSEDGQCYRSELGPEVSIGMYYSDGVLNWYECPVPGLMGVGKEFLVNLYLANPENGKAVKYEISVEIVKELQTESVAYVRSLPVGMGTPDGIERPTPSPSLGKGAIYDLQGRRLQKAPEKGMYLMKSKSLNSKFKKVVIK